ncbi:PTS sugar transporter subunit IIB [Brachyspira intermedia]|uniref:PTS sugar transporter subunit IIB n=1 Tax=Brachyspira intermedia TaxID=84377 RepID=UPI0030042174
MVKILAVCGMGLGSSFAVEMVTEEVMKELGIEAEISHTTVSDAASIKTDIIITSTNFAETLNAYSLDSKIVALHKLTDKQEIKEKLSPILMELGYLK